MKQITRSHLARHHTSTAAYQALGLETMSTEQRLRQARGLSHRIQPGEWAGDAHPRWKGGHINPKSGYRMLWDNGRLTYEHRLIMERHLGRPLDRREIVHHNDGDPLNNAIENLTLMSQAEHRRRHATEGTTPPPPRNWASRPHKGLDVDRIVAMVRAGSTDAAIGEELGISRHTIRRRLASVGIKRPSGNHRQRIIPAV